MKKIDKLDLVLEKVNKIETKVEVQHEVLLEHQRRSLAAEVSLGLLEGRTEKIEARFLKLDGAARLIALAITTITVLDMLLKIYEHVKLLRP